MVFVLLESEFLFTSCVSFGVADGDEREPPAGAVQVERLLSLHLEGLVYTHGSFQAGGYPKIETSRNLP